MEYTQKDLEDVLRLSTKISLNLKDQPLNPRRNQTLREFSKALMEPMDEFIEDDKLLTPLEAIIILAISQMYVYRKYIMSPDEFAS